MDDQRFDQLTRLLGSGLSRKRFLRLLTGATVSGVAVIATERLAPAKRHKGGGKGPNPEGDTCGGDCATDDDCGENADCVCDTSAGSCAIVTCGGTCANTEECRQQGLAACTCVFPARATHRGRKRGAGPVRDGSLRRCGLPQG